MVLSNSNHLVCETGIFYRTRGVSPIEVPAHSLAAQRGQFAHHTHSDELGEDVWFGEPCGEHVLFSDQYNFTISLLHFADARPRAAIDEEHQTPTRE